LASSQLGAVVAADTAQMPVLHLGEVQSGGVAASRWAACLVLSSPGAMPFLLAAVLLDIVAWSTRGLSIWIKEDLPDHAAKPAWRMRSVLRSGASCFSSRQEYYWTVPEKPAPFELISYRECALDCLRMNLGDRAS